jgi:hypothetical protein
VNNDALATLASIVGERIAGRVHQVMADDGSQQRKPDFRTPVEDVVKALATVLIIEAQSDY